MNIFTFLKKKQSKQRNLQKKNNQEITKKTQIKSITSNPNKQLKQTLNQSNQREDTQFSLIPRIKKNKTTQQLQQNTPKIINRVMTQFQNQETSKIQKKTIIIDKFQDYQANTNSLRGQQQYKQISLKYCIQLKKILSKLELIYAKLESQYELIQKMQLNYSLKQVQPIKKQINLVRNCQTCRFQQNLTIYSIKRRYCQAIQSCELLISKLINRVGKNVHFHKQKKDKLDQQKLNKIYVSNQQQFLLFFKHFFSKPYKLCNLPSMRKILQIVWEFINLQNYNVQISIDKLIQSIKLWIYSISVPSNPSLITLHKLSIQNQNLIPKYVKMSMNEKIYLGINQSDALGLTPLILAAFVLNKKALQKLLKSGANPLICPLYISQGIQNYSSTITKYGKNLFTINYPIHHRKQFNFLQILLNKKQYKLLSQCFYWIELGEIKEFKKNKQLFIQKLISIPDCSFQIVWKTFKGILCFKELPSDVITIYKKNSMLRIDFHIDNIEHPQKGKRFTLIIKAQKDKQIQFYQIRHHSKKIINRLKQVDMKHISKKYEDFIKYPHLKYEKLGFVKGMYSFSSNENQTKNVQISMNTQFYCQHMPYKQFKQFNHEFKNSQNYEEQIINSDLFNYQQIQKSQLSSVLNQKVLNLNNPKIKKFKGKIQKSSLNLELELQKKLINLTHMKALLSQFSKDSFILKKLQQILDIILNEEIFRNNQKNISKQILNFSQMFPKSIKLHLQNSFNFQIDFKNINYSLLPDQIFNVECHLKEDQNYESQGDQIQNSLRSTVIMDDGLSINISRFLGKTQRMFQFEEQQALKKYQNILSANTMSQVVSDQQDNYFSKQ